jgi:hypothetical protein
MPVTQRIDKEAGVVYRTATGHLEMEELVTVVLGAIDHPDYRPGMKSLTDLRGIDHEVTREDIQRLAELLRGRQTEISGGRGAIVVSSDVSFGMARMLEGLTTQVPYELNVFRDIAEACAWLGIPVPTRSEAS